MSVEYRDYYATLGLKRTATNAEIKKAFRRLAQEFHPDRVGEDTKAGARFREVNEAYEVLGDRARRREYDQLGADLRAGQRLEGELAKRAAAAMKSRRAAVKAAAARYGASPVATLLDRARALLGLGAKQKGARRKLPDGDREQELAVTFEAALAGEKAKVPLAEGKSLSVQLPADLRPGQRIRLKGQGGKRRDGSPGDLHLVVRFEPSVEHRFDGDALVRTLPISTIQALYGATVAITVNGATLNVKVPAGTKSGARLRLRGHGLPGAGGARGDLMLELRIAG
jgi:curved DNA-binding protein